MGGGESGGLETHFVELANALAAGGDQLTAIAHPRHAGGLREDVRFAPLDLARGRRNPLLRRRLGRLIEAAAPDVVHAQGGKAAHLVAALRPAGALVGTVHGVKSSLAAWRRFDAVIGVSDGVLEGLEHPRKHVVYNGVHPPPTPLSGEALRRRFDIPARRRVAVAVGRLAPVKGFDRLIALWEDALGHLLVLGDGRERERLARLAQGKPVTLAGYQADARAILGGADLVAFASRREGFPYAMAEALRARVPVVSTPVPGAAELLLPEHLGREARLKAAIERALAEPEAARARMAAVFDWAAEALTVERMASATRAVYAGLVA